MFAGVARTMAKKYAIGQLTALLDACFVAVEARIGKIDSLESLIQADATTVADAISTVPGVADKITAGNLALLIRGAQFIYPRLNLLKRLDPEMRVHEIDEELLLGAAEALGVTMDATMAHQLVVTAKAVYEPDATVSKLFDSGALLRLAQGQRYEAPVFKICSGCGLTLDPAALICSCGEITL